MAEMIKDQMLEDEIAKDKMGEDEVDINPASSAWTGGQFSTGRLQNQTAGWPAVPSGPAGFYCSKQWQAPGTGRNRRSTGGWVLKPPLHGVPDELASSTYSTCQ